MAGETIITVVGNVTADPELRFTHSGMPVVNFTIASTPRTLDRASGEWKDGDALFLRASAWREFAEHIAGSISKGTRVIAQGNLRQRNYETREGERRTAIELEVLEIGPSLRYATAQVTRTASNSQQNTRTNNNYPQQATNAPAPNDTAALAADAWAVPNGGMIDDDTPF